jgi:hypothetical protein
MVRPTVFISYSYHDEEWKERLLSHLEVLGKQGILDVWDDRRIGAGDDWRREIELAMERSSVAVLLLSADFLSSDFVLTEEVPRLLERRRRDGLPVVPVLVRPCVWEAVEWLAPMELLPRNDRAISAGSSHDIEADFALVATVVKSALDPEERAARSVRKGREGPESTARPGEQHTNLGTAGAGHADPRVEIARIRSRTIILCVTLAVIGAVLYSFLEHGGSAAIAAFLLALAAALLGSARVRRLEQTPRVDAGSARSRSPTSMAKQSLALSGGAGLIVAGTSFWLASHPGSSAERTAFAAAPAPATASAGDHARAAAPEPASAAPSLSTPEGSSSATANAGRSGPDASLSKPTISSSAAAAIKRSGASLSAPKVSPPRSSVGSGGVAAGAPASTTNSMIRAGLTPKR